MLVQCLFVTLMPMGYLGISLYCQQMVYESVPVYPGYLPTWSDYLYMGFQITNVKYVPLRSQVATSCLAHGAPSWCRFMVLLIQSGCPKPYCSP